MSAVTAWTSDPGLRCDESLGMIAASPLGRNNAREAYRAMRNYGMPTWEARCYVIRLLGARSDIILRTDVPS